MSIQLIREAAATLRESNNQAEARAIERFLSELQRFGKERHEQIRCKRYEDAVKMLEAQLNLLRPPPQRQLSEEQGRRMQAALFRDENEWAARGGMID